MDVDTQLSHALLDIDLVPGNQWLRFMSCNTAWAWKFETVLPDGLFHSWAYGFFTCRTSSNLNFYKFTLISRGSHKRHSRVKSMWSYRPPNRSSVVPAALKSQQPLNRKMQFCWTNMAMYRFGLSTESYNYLLVNLCQKIST